MYADYRNSNLYCILLIIPCFFFSEQFAVVKLLYDRFDERINRSFT